MRNITEFTYGVADYDKYWQSRKTTGDTAETGIHRRIVELVRQHVPTGSRVLDCGVGPGVYYRALADEYEMHGIEFSEEAIALYQFDRRRIVSFDLNRGLPEFGTHFRGMVASMIIHHLDDPNVFLRAAHSKLKKGGILIIACPNIVYYKHRLRLLVGKFPRYSTSHRNFITPHHLTGMVEAAGFSLESITSKKRKWLPTLLAPELFFVCALKS
jgi:2-polyprenyl-3-methyl-5-hydroxy-6-metoxy-1,4-benzoquinol methylase